MKINSNMNAMVNIDKSLDASAKNIANISLNTKETTNKDDVNNSDLLSEITKEIELPIAYTANAQVITMQDETTQTLIDIKA